MDILNPQDLAEGAKKTYQQGDFLTAAQQFEAAAEAYQAQEDAPQAAEMRNNQSVALLQIGEAQKALDVLDGTLQTFEAAGEDLKAAMAIGNQAAALEALNRLEEAEDLYRQCAERLQALGENELRANVMQSISQIQLRTGRQLEALANIQDGLDGVESPNLRQRFLKKLLQLPAKLLRK